ncbi:MAG: hypothetical protein IJN90_05940 [Bacilli bacterium]|nr:hypothetical protein [Bacilli bacterium]
MNEEYDYIVDAFTQDGENTNLEVNNLNVECITSKNNTFSLDSEGNLVVKSITAQEGLMSQSGLLDYIYPIGSIYISVNNVNPAISFGGTWEQVKDKFLLSAGDTYAGGATGGAATHTHGLSNGYALINPSANVAAIYGKIKTVSNWTDNFKSTISGKAASFSGNNTRGIALAGNSNSASSLPPYIAVYVWKRTA